jgi:hypothetical protein
VQTRCRRASRRLQPRRAGLAGQGRFRRLPDKGALATAPGTDGRRRHQPRQLPRHRHLRQRRGTPERLLRGPGRAKAQPAVAGRQLAEPADSEARPTEYPGLREQPAPRNRRRRNKRRQTRGAAQRSKRRGGRRTRSRKRRRSRRRRRSARAAAVAAAATPPQLTAARRTAPAAATPTRRQSQTAPALAMIGEKRRRRRMERR